MKKSTVLLVLTSIICCAILWSASPIALLYRSQPPAGVSGSPSDGTTCAAGGCHTGSIVQSKTGWITSNIPSVGYVAGTTYTITATATYSGRSTFGFEISPQNVAGTILGTLVNTSSQTTLIGGGYVGHSSNGVIGSNSKTWTFDWIAPVTGTGSVTFYGAFNAANGTGGTGGDFIFTSTLTVSEVIPFANDASISNVVYPTSTACPSFSPQVKLVNKGTSTLTSTTINYKLDGGTNNTFSWTGNLISNASTTVTLNNMSVGTGTHTLDVNSSMPNGVTDQKPSNDAAATVNFSVANPTALPFNEGFEGTTFVPVGWALNNPDGATTWIRTTAAAKTGSGAASIDNANYSTKNEHDEMVLPALDLTSKNSPALTFELAYKLWTDPNSTTFDLGDTLEVLISTDCGATFTTIYKKWKVGLTTTTPNFQNSVWIPAGANDWRKETIDLSPYATASNAIIVFRNINDFQNDLYIDDISIDGTTANCAVTASATTTTNVSCNGGNNGAITVSANGGTPAYSYNTGSGSQSTGSFNNLTAGTYTVTVSDAGGCSTTVNAVVTEPTAVTATVATKGDISCNGFNDGTATILSNGGTPNYTYNVGTGVQGVGSFTNLSAATYTVTVTDSKNCTGTTNFTVVEPAVLAASIASSNNISCNGLNDGSFVVSATGGTVSYTYNDGMGAQSNSSFTGQSAGNYIIIIKDAHNCSTNTSVNITEPAVINALATITSNYNGSDISCKGASDGTVTVTGSGGTGLLTGIGVVSNVGVGANSFTVTDTKGCSKSTSVTLVEPSVINITGTTTAAACGSSNGSVSVTVSGGTGNKTYNWNNGAISQNLSNVGAGSYTLIVSDANSCTANYVGVVNNTGGLSATTTSTNISCATSADGIATVTAIGGTAPYTYSWLPAPGTGQGTANASNMNAGVYTINVTDNGGCVSSKMITITEPTPVVAAGIINNAICGNTNGTINVTTTGGTAPYNFNWNNGAITENLSNLANGTYTLVITDSKGCTGNYAGTITTSGSLTMQINSNDVTCNGDVNGSAAVNVTSGSAPFNYIWSPAPTTGQGVVNATMGAGTYTVSVSDVNGCSQTSTFTITEPSAIVITGAVVNTTCGKANGSINTAVSGGSGGYTFTWNAGTFNTPLLNNVAAGNYTLEIIDNTGCTAYYSAQITNTGGATLSMASVDVSCFNQQDGIISTAITGGKPPYAYNWNNGATSAGVNNLDAGAYSVTVTDGNGCESIQNNIIITQPSAIAVIATITDVVSGSDGAINISVAGGVPPYLYDWNNDGTGDNNDPQNLTNISVGTYQVIVIDSSGCTFSLFTNVGGSTAVEEQNSEAYFDVYPNPSKGEFNINFNDLTAKDLVVTIIDINGQQVFLKKFNNTASSFSTTVNIDNFSNGMYFVKITTGDKFMMKRIVKQ